MKVKILKKSIKEGENYCIKSLFCSVDNKEDANALAKLAVEAGATPEQVQQVIRAGEYEGKTTYAFGLNCSGFTFDRVERFGILDAEIVYQKSEKGFISAKIKVVDKKERIHGYEPPEDDVTGWATEAPEVKEHKSEYVPPTQEPLPPFPDPLDPSVHDDLPF